MLNLSHVTCRLQLHHWQYQTKGHSFEGFVYPVNYRCCNGCKLAQVKIMNPDSADII